MDMISTAMLSINAQQSMQKSQIATSMLKQNHESQQAIVGLIQQSMDSVSSGPTYNASGSVSSSSNVGSTLNIKA